MARAKTIQPRPEQLPANEVSMASTATRVAVKFPPRSLFRVRSEAGVDLGEYGPEAAVLLSSVKNGMAPAYTLDVGMTTEVHHKMDSTLGRDTRVQRFFVERVR